MLFIGITTCQSRCNEFQLCMNIHHRTTMSLQFCPKSLFVSILGEVVITDPNPLQFSLQTMPTSDPPVYTLTCVSTGGPATNVNWTRDGAAATGVTSQSVVDQAASTYHNILTVTGRQSGLYTCSVSNDRSAQPANASLSVFGESCSVLQFNHSYISTYLYDKC